MTRTWITDAVRTRRAIKGMSRTALANSAGVSTSTIKSIEDGDQIPNTATLEAILHVFGAELVVQDFGED